MRMMIERNFVNVIGKIRMPAVTCAMRYDLSKHDVEDIGEFTLENVEQWLASHAGDFQSVEDFQATVGDQWIEWKKEESELTFNDCMYPNEE
jgi:hypothetical protein